ncbi:MAG: Flp pilus assembly protein CpaB [Alphaproteobacteria bacterium]|nr:Flp pilus assembly protein CpaB [Alphaproteobacteria bacterium]
MKSRKIKIYLSLLAVSLLLTLMLNQYLTQPEKIAQIIKPQTQKIILINDHIPANTLINLKFCEMKDYPIELIPENALKDFAQIEGQKAFYPIFKGEILTKTKLIKAEFPPAYYELQPHERALFLPIKENLQLQPNDRVDLVLTHKFKRIKEGLVKEKTQSHILVQHLRVLDVPQMDKSKSIDKPGVTFAVLENDVSKILLGAEIGKISFVKYPETSEKSASSSLKITENAFIKPKKKKQQEVIFIKGQKTESYVFKN